MAAVFFLFLLSCIGILNFVRFGQRKHNLISVDVEEQKSYGRTDKARYRTEALKGKDDLDYGEPATIDISSFKSKESILLLLPLCDENFMSWFISTVKDFLRSGEAWVG